MSMHVLLQLPLPVIKGANVASLQPARDAVEVKRVLKIYDEFHDTMMEQRASTHVTDTPCGVALLAGGGDLVRLAIDTYA